MTHGRTLEEGDDSEWEETDEALKSDEESKDGDEFGGPARFNEKEFFQRVTLRPKPVSPCSLLTASIHEKNQASALHNAASCSDIQGPPPPSIVTAFRSYPPVLSLRSTNMISEELTGSLRECLLRERKSKGSTLNDTRGSTSLQKYSSENGNSSTIHFNDAFQGFHQRGW